MARRPPPAAALVFPLPQQGRTSPPRTPSTLLEVTAASARRRRARRPFVQLFKRSFGLPPLLTKSKQGRAGSLRAEVTGLHASGTCPEPCAGELPSVVKRPAIGARRSASAHRELVLKHAIARDRSRAGTQQSLTSRIKHKQERCSSAEPSCEPHKRYPAEEPCVRSPTPRRPAAFRHKPT